jgi:alpha-tubulin suppressor-like RCC1 family protein
VKNNDILPPLKLNPNFNKYNDTSRFIKNTIRTFCWGSNSHGQTDIPIEIHNIYNKSDPNNQKVSVILQSGSYFSCTIFDTNIICWGINNVGQSTPLKSMQMHRRL